MLHWAVRFSGADTELITFEIDVIVINARLEVLQLHRLPLRLSA